MKDDKHSDPIPEEALEDAQIKIDAIKAAFASSMVPLTPEERHKMLKMGEKSLAFVEKAHDFAHQNPELVPDYLDMDAFDVDFQDAHGLWRLINSIEQLLDNLSDTVMAAGSEALQASLVFYKSVKVAAAQDIPGAEAVYNELKTRFPQRGGKHNTSETETETDPIKKKATRN
jgi:hypothetical protein